MTPEETLAWYIRHYDASDPFGSKKPPRNPNGLGHLGSDFNGVPEGTEFPSWCDGKVVGSGFSSVVGWFVVVKTAGGYALFYHLDGPGLAYGLTVSVGTILGRVGNTGSTSNGAHLHAGFSQTSSTAGTLAVEDPWPLIASTLIRSAASTESDSSMFFLRRNLTGEVHLFGHPTEGHKHVENPDQLALLNTLIANVRPPGIPVPARDPAQVFGVNDDLWDIAVAFFGTPAKVAA